MKKYTPTLLEFDPKETYELPKAHTGAGWTGKQFNDWLRFFAEKLKEAPENKTGYSGYFGLYRKGPLDVDPKIAGLQIPHGTSSCYGSAVNSWGYGEQIPFYGECFQGSFDAKHTPFFEYLMCRKHSPFARLMPDPIRVVYDNQHRLRGWLSVDTSKTNALVAVAMGLMHRMIQSGARGDLYIKFLEAGCTRLEAMLLAQLHYQHNPMISYTTRIDGADKPKFMSRQSYHTCLDWHGSTYAKDSTFSLPKFLRKDPTIDINDKFQLRTIWMCQGYSPCNIIWNVAKTHDEAKITEQFEEALDNFWCAFFDVKPLGKSTVSRWAPKPSPPIAKDMDEVNLKDSEYILAVTKWFKEYRRGLDSNVDAEAA